MQEYCRETSACHYKISDIVQKSVEVADATSHDKDQCDMEKMIQIWLYNYTGNRHKTLIIKKKE